MTGATKRTPGSAEHRDPLWVMPVLIGLPLWALLYVGAFRSTRDATPVDTAVLGARVYRSAGCSGCHGPTGEGVGTFPRLAGGQAALTFPNIADHISWIKTGSGPSTGQRYGDPARTGGQHGPATGFMPAFAGRLTDNEIRAVAEYERTKL